MKYLIGLCAFTLILEASPEGGKVVHGDASMLQSGNELHVTAGDKTIIDWQHFGIKEGEAVRFIQSSKDSAVLNRDVGGVRSDILGSLSASGKVYLINKSGIFIGKDAVIDTGSFIGSTFDVLNEDFIRGNELVFSESDGAIVNHGKIIAEDGEVFLFSNDITHKGVIKGQNVYLYKPHGTDKIYARGTSYQSAIKGDGNIEAYGVENRGGRIFLVADKVDVSGDLMAEGGEVRVLGDHINLDALINVSGEQGGTILVGGDYQGNNPDIRNAKTTTLSGDAELIADSTGSGNGGRVIVWSDNRTQFLGIISAQGGPRGGDGGFVEVSGKYGLDYRPDLVSTLAPQGKAGTLLLDPADITISAGADVNIAGNFNAAACVVGTNLTPATLIGAGGLAGGNVIVTTALIGCAQSGDITVLDNVVYSSPNTLQLLANNNIYVGAHIQNDDVAGTGTITLTANGNIQIGYTAAATVAGQESIVGSISATTTLTATTGFIKVGDATSSFLSQVGYGFTPPAATNVTGNIVVHATTANQDITVTAGNTALNSYSQIGHGRFGTAYEGLQGTIEVIAGRHVTLTAAPNQDDSYAQIGHGGNNVTNTVNDITSPGVNGINVSANGGTVALFGGRTDSAGPCYAQIGHGGVGVNNDVQTLGHIRVNAALDVTLLNGDGTFGYAQIGHGGATSTYDALINGNITITNGRNVSLVTQDSLRAQAMIGHGGTQITTNANILGDISITGAAGTLTMQAFNGPVVLGNRNFTQIGHGGAESTQPIAGTHWQGNITVSLAGAATLGAGDAVGQYTQIGHGGYTSQPVALISGIAANTGIRLTFGSLSMTASSGPTDLATGAYCQIGHGGSLVDLTGAAPIGNPGSYSGNIVVTTTTGSITVDGGGTAPASTLAHDAPAQIGHGGMSQIFTNANAVAITGDISVTAATSLDLIAGTAAAVPVQNGGAWVGHGPTPLGNAIPLTITGNLNATASSGSITLTGGSTPVIARYSAVIGNGVSFPAPATTFTGNETITASQNINLNGGLGVGADAILTAPSGIQTVTAINGNIVLQGGIGNAAGADIFSDGTQQTVRAVAGQINLFGGDGISSDAFIRSNCAVQTVNAFQDILARGGTTANVSNALVNNVLATGLTRVISDTGSVFFQNGGVGQNPAAINLLFAVTQASIEIGAGQDIALSSNVSTVPSLTSTILIHANTLGNGLGSFVIDTRGYDNAGAVVSPATQGISFEATSNPGVAMTILATDRIANGQPADFVVGDRTDIAFGPASAFLGGAPTLPGAFTGNAATILVTHYRDIWFISSEPAFGASVANANGSVTFIADRDMHLTTSLSPALITGAEVTLVVDNYFPVSPGIGTGSFLMDPAPVTITSPQIKIFTARQPLNSAGETLNGLVFVPGPLFVDTNHEHWLTYFNNPFFGGPFFTIFYKDGPPPPLQPGTAITMAQAGISQSFFDTRDYDEKMYWMKLYITYNREKYLSNETMRQGLSKTISYLDNYQKIYFWKWVFHGISSLESLSSYEVARNEEFMLPPNWKGYIK